MSFDWTGAHVLVTGAGGFIGSHLCERLVELGANVCAFVHYRGDGSAGWLDQSPKRGDMEIVAGDIRDSEFVMHTAFAKRPAVVFHLAALIGIPYSYIAPRSYLETNVTGTINILDAARWDCVDRLIVTSTSEVYGTAQYVPMDEKHPLSPQSPYAASKIAADALALSYHRSFAVPVTIVRPFNTYGPRQSARAVIPTIITQALAGGPIRIGNLAPRRDFTYVTDTVEGFIKAAECEAAIGEVINLGMGDTRSVDEWATAILMAMDMEGMEIVVDTLRERPVNSEVDELCADASKADRLLNWNPGINKDVDPTSWYSTFSQGLARTIEWFRANPQPVKGYAI